MVGGGGGGGRRGGGGGGGGGVGGGGGKGGGGGREMGLGMGFDADVRSRWGGGGGFRVGLFWRCERGLARERYRAKGAIIR